MSFLRRLLALEKWAQNQLTDWIDFTPVFDTANWLADGANAVNFAKWKRVGSDMQVRMSFTLSTGSESGSDALVPLPSGYAINKSLCRFGSSNATVVGFWERMRGGYGIPYNAKYFGFVTPRNTGALQLTYGPDSNTNFANYDIDGIFEANETVVVDYTVPIVGWTSKLKG